MPPEPVVRHFDGGMLRARREAAGLTQERLGELIGVDETTINKYERGARKPTADRLEALAAELQAQPDDLLLDGPGAGTLVHLRLQAGLSQTAAGALIGLQRTTYASVEYGDRPLPGGAAERLAEGFNVTVGEIKSAYSLSRALREAQRTDGC